MVVRHDRSREEIEALLELPRMELFWPPQQVDRTDKPGHRAQPASLHSPTTGRCADDWRTCTA